MLTTSLDGILGSVGLKSCTWSFLYHLLYFCTMNVSTECQRLFEFIVIRNPSSASMKSDSLLCLNICLLLSFFRFVKKAPVRCLKD